MEMLVDALVAALQDAYDLVPPVTPFALEHAGLNNVNTGIRTGAGDFVVRVHDSLSYDDPAALAYEHALLTWLAEQRLSFAVPVPMLTRAGEPACHGPAGWTTLTPKLPGTSLALQPYDPTLLGAVVGELQAALAHCPAGVRPGRPLFGDLFGFGGPGLDALHLRPEDVGLPADAAHDALFGRWRDEAARLAALVVGAYRDLPFQVCHNDVTPNNVLDRDGVVTAVLDFEYVTPTPGRSTS